jgi:flagellar FliL protein
MPVRYLRIILGSLLLMLMTNPGHAADDEEKVATDGPAYISLGKPMILNLANTNRKSSFLQLQADILVKNETSKEAIEIHVPAIRHQLIVLLSEQPAADLKTPEKRELVRQQATEEVRDMLAKLARNKGVEEVLFSSFLVQ